jgi:soluble lytic murein transglycosylase-like protein
MFPIQAAPPPTPPAQIEYVVPVTAECVLSASQHYNVPVALITAIMDTESGEVAKANNNSNGTQDYGPMQINTIWLKELEQYGFTQKVLINNGCANVFAGTWILAGKLAKYPTWEAVGRYHSNTPHLKRTYQQRVAARLRSITKISDVIGRANRTIFKNLRKKHE